MNRRFFNSHKYLLILFILPFIVFWRNIIPIKGMAYFGNDIAISFNTLASIIKQLRDGFFPLWDPHTFFGIQLVTRPDSLVFYPPAGALVLISALLKLSDTAIYKFIEFFTIFHFSLAGIFTYLLLKHYKLSDFSAFCGGMIYMLSGALVAFANTTGILISLAYFPLVLMRFDILVKQPSLRNSLIFALIYALTITTFAWTLVIVYNLIFFLFYYLFLLCRKQVGLDRRIVFWTALGFILSLFVAAVVVLPGFQVPLISTRADIDFHRSAFSGNLVLRQLFDFLMPYLSAKNYGEAEVLKLYYNLSLTFTYVGIFSLLLIIPAFFKKNLYVLFFSISALLWLLFSLGGETPVFGLTYIVFYPLMKSFSEPRLSVYIPQLSLAVVAAFGLENVTVHFNSLRARLKKYRRILIRIVQLCFLVLVIFFFRIDQYVWQYFPYEETSIPMLSQLNSFMIFFLLLAGSVAIFSYLGKLEFSRAKLLIFLILFFDLFLFAEKYPLNTIGIDPSKLYSNNEVVKFITKNNVDGFYRSDIRSIPQNYVPSLLGINHMDGYLVYQPKTTQKYYFLVTPNPRNELADNIAGIRYIVTEKNLDNKNYDLVYEKVIAEKDQPYYYHLAGNPSGWLPIPLNTSIKVYENKNYSPLLHMVQKTIFVNDEEAKNQIVANSFNPMEVALVDKSYQNDFSKYYIFPSEKPGTVTMISDQPAQKKMLSNNKYDSILITSYPYNNEWKAYIDGAPAKLLRVNLAFMGLIVPEGKHTIILSYVPIVFYIGLIVSILATGASIYILLRIQKINNA